MNPVVNENINIICFSKFSKMHPLTKTFLSQGVHLTASYQKHVTGIHRVASVRFENIDDDLVHPAYAQNKRQ